MLQHRIGVIASLLLACGLAQAGAVKVELVQKDGRWQMLRDGKPYVVRGGGYHDGSKAVGIHARTLRRDKVGYRLDGVRLVCLTD